MLLLLHAHVSFGGPSSLPVQYLMFCEYLEWMQNSFHIFMFVQKKGGTVAIFITIFIALFVCQRRGGTLAIFMALCLCQRRDENNSGYIHGAVCVYQ